MKLKIVLLLLLIVKIINANEIIKIIPPQSQYDASHKYFSTLLELILNDIENTTKIAHTYKMQQGRALER